MIIKSVLWVAVGAVGALESERLVSRFKSRFAPSVVTGGLIDKLNSKLESNRASSASKDAPAPGL